MQRGQSWGQTSQSKATLPEATAGAGFHERALGGKKKKKGMRVSESERKRERGQEV